MGLGGCRAAGGRARGAGGIPQGFVLKQLIEAHVGMGCRHVNRGFTGQSLGDGQTQGFAW